MFLSGSQKSPKDTGMKTTGCKCSNKRKNEYMVSLAPSCGGALFVLLIPKSLILDKYLVQKNALLIDKHQFNREIIPAKGGILS